MGDINKFVVEVEGIKMAKFFSKDCFRSALHFTPNSGDIFVVTYPKCGTTWMQNLVINILRRGRPLQNPKDFYLASPFLDMLGANDSEKLMIRPGAFKTHLPLNKIPWSNDAKYIYVARNPKDCCISFYHHMHTLPGYQLQELSLDDYIKGFLNGEFEYGSYFDHLIPWYQARHMHNVFFTTFESMKSDLRNVALQVAQFIGEDEYEALTSDVSTFNRILRNCRFDVMKLFINEALSSLYNSDVADIPEGRRHVSDYVASITTEKNHKIEFLRKGEVGSWKGELTQAQSELIDKTIHEKTVGSDVMSLWNNII